MDSTSDRSDPLGPDAPHHLLRIRAGASADRSREPDRRTRASATGTISVEHRYDERAGEAHLLDPDLDSVDIAVFAWEWARVLAATGYVALDRTVVAAQLQRRTNELIEAVRTEPFDSAPGTQVGRELVATGYTAPDALRATLALLSDRFVAAHEPARTRSGELVAAVGAGFVRAVRDRTLAEQESIRSSALLAVERVRADQAAARRRDPVTGLHNREGFEAALGELLASAGPGVLGVCLLSLGGFEPLDRGFGPVVGDSLLRTVADRLSACFGGRRDLVGRVGRDEFIVAALGSGERTLQPDMAERVAAAQQAVREPIALEDRAVVLSPSVGVVSRHTRATEPQAVLRDVGLAGSWARERGPGSVALFDLERATRQIAGLTLAAELPAALRSGRLLTYYQPIVALPSGRTHTLEALARWEHGRRGLLEPDAFIPLARRAGLIDELGRTVLERACRQGLIWSQCCARPPMVSVNLAPEQLAEPGTVREVVDVLERTGLPPHLLQLEITEDCALGDRAAQAVIRDLAHVGISLALDDFGTGQAHLGRLADLPGLGVRTLKLAGCLLRSAPRDPEPRPLRDLTIPQASVINSGHARQGDSAGDNSVGRDGADSKQRAVITRTVGALLRPATRLLRRPDRPTPDPVDLPDRADLPERAAELASAQVRDAADDDGRYAVLASTIALGHRLGMQVTVEGVQTARDEALVAALGADHAQGSFYSVPVPAAELDGRLTCR